MGTLRRLRRVVVIALSAFVVLVSSVVGGWHYAFCIPMQRAMHACCCHREMTHAAPSETPSASAPCCETRLLSGHDAGVTPTEAAVHVAPIAVEAPRIVIAESLPSSAPFFELRAVRIGAPRGPPPLSARERRTKLSVFLC